MANLHSNRAEKTTASLVDSHQRRFVYLRLSVTDRCNFSCAYCLPDGYSPESGSGETGSPELSLSEIERLVRGFARLGVSKVRLTGGEPTVRRDIVELARVVSSVQGIQKVALTTNGSRLPELALPLLRAGVSSINISIDSLEEERFREITGSTRFASILQSVDQALDAGFERVKVNAVLLKNRNDHELLSFMDWVRDRPISVRFIELMRTGTNAEYFNQNHLSAGVIRLELLKAGWTPTARGVTDGPAVVYRHPRYEGSIGLIAPYSQDFCTTCNRLRVTAQGALKLCLFGERDLSLRDLLQEDSQTEELASRIQALVLEKPLSHELHEGKYGNTRHFAGIGG